MKEFQRLAATALYLAGDRFEIQNAVTHLMRGMCNPLQLHWLQLCRLAAYLHAHQSYEILFRYQEMPNLVYAEVDSDWAGCLETRRSTDGGYEFFGTSLLDGWANTQQSIALSSGEAELYGVCNGAARVLWTKNLLDECGFTVTASVGTDSTAAKGITARLGTGKVRHLETRCLWIQERVRSKEISILKVPTEEEPGRHADEAFGPHPLLDAHGHATAQTHYHGVLQRLGGHDRDHDGGVRRLGGGQRQVGDYDEDHA